MIADMRLAAREDRDKNAQKIPATKKISMLPSKLNIFLVKSLGAIQEIKSFNEFYMKISMLPSKLHVSEFEKKTRLFNLANL